MALRVYQYGVEVLLTDASSSTIYEPSIDDPIAFDETLDTQTTYNVSLEDELGFDGSTETHDGTIQTAVTDVIQFIQNTDIHATIRNLVVADELGFIETLRRQIDIEIDDPIAFLDETFRIFTLSQELGLTQSVSPSITRPLRQFLSFVQGVARQIISSRTIADSLALRQAVLVLHLTNGMLCQYVPQGDLPAEPTLVPSDFTLFYPAITPTTTLILPNPEVGNRTSYLPNRISRKSRGGTKQVFRDPAWPTLTTLTMDIGSLTTTQRGDLRDFLILTLGKTVGLLDYEGRAWTGIISNPDAEFTTLSDYGCGTHATTIVFDGELVS